MDIINDLLFWLHLTALAAGGVATFGIPVVGSKMPTATPEQRPLLFSIIEGLSKVSRAALGVLIVTGPLMVWLKYGGTSGFSFWFWVKMVLVVILFAGVIYAGILLKRAKEGDREAAQMQPRLGMGLMVVLLGVILSAVFTFH